MSPAAPDPREVAPPSIRPRDVRPGMVVWNPYGGARGRAQVASEPRERPDGAIEFDTADGRTALFSPGFRALYLDAEATAQLSVGPEAGTAHHERPGQVQAHLTGPDPSLSHTQKGSAMTVTNQQASEQPAPQSDQTREQAELARAARICQEAGATAEQAAGAAQGNPELAGLAGAMRELEREAGA